MNYQSFICLAVAAFFAASTISEAKIFKRCEFVRIARKHFPKNEVADWTCIAQHESSFNTRAINVNKGGSKDHGIFQINDVFWCSPGKHNICKVSCAALRSDNLDQAMRCAKIVKKQQGFKAWVAWNNKCKGKNLASYTKAASYLNHVHV